MKEIFSLELCGIPKALALRCVVSATGKPGARGSTVYLLLRTGTGGVGKGVAGVPKSFPH